jgi:hypothetical protein
MGDFIDAITARYCGGMFRMTEREFSCGRRMRLFLGIALLAVLSAALSGARGAEAAVAEPGERFNLYLASPILNNSGARIWGSKYYPGDVLPEKMEDYLFRRLRQIPRLDPSVITGATPERWPTVRFNPGDVVVRINLEEFYYRKKDMLGSKLRWDVAIHMYVHDAPSGRIIYDSVIERRDNRFYVLYNDMLEEKPVYWDDFRETPYWLAIRHALDDAFDELIRGYNGYRVVGQIVAKAERVDGSLSVPAQKQDKLYHINIGREDSVKVGDIFAVTRSSSVRTIAPETPEMHFPQIVARVRVVFVKGRDAVVEVVKESSLAPIQLGDSVSAPLYGGRDGVPAYRGRKGGF